MGTLEDEMRDLIKERFGGVPKLAKVTGVNKQTIYSALTSGLRGSAIETIMPLVEALQIDPLWLARGRLVPLPTDTVGYVEIPLLGTITAGTPAEALATSERHAIPASVHKRFPHAFLLSVSGESMNRVLPDGSYALINPCTEVDVSGDIYAVALGQDNATLKRVRKLENGLELIPESIDPTFRPLVLNFNDPSCESAHIIGKLVWFCMPNNWSYAPLGAY